MTVLVFLQSFFLIILGLLLVLGIGSYFFISKRILFSHNIWFLLWFLSLLWPSLVCSVWWASTFLSCLWTNRRPCSHPRVPKFHLFWFSNQRTNGHLTLKLQRNLRRIVHWLTIDFQMRRHFLNFDVRIYVDLLIQYLLLRTLNTLFFWAHFWIKKVMILFDCTGREPHTRSGHIW